MLTSAGDPEKVLTFTIQRIVRHNCMYDTILIRERRFSIYPAFKGKVPVLASGQLSANSINSCLNLVINP
jgi:hypothetical protein